MDEPAIEVYWPSSSWSHIGGPTLRLLVDLDSTNEHALEISDIADEGDVDAVLDAIARDGRAGTPDFAMITWEPELRAVFKGEVRIEVIRDGERLLLAPSSPTRWMDVDLDNDTSVSFILRGPTDIDDELTRYYARPPGSPAFSGSDTASDAGADIGEFSAEPDLDEDESSERRRKRAKDTSRPARPIPTIASARGESAAPPATPEPARPTAEPEHRQPAAEQTPAEVAPTRSDEAPQDAAVSPEAEPAPAEPDPDPAPESHPAPRTRPPVRSWASVGRPPTRSWDAVASKRRSGGTPASGDAPAAPPARDPESARRVQAEIDHVTATERPEPPEEHHEPAPHRTEAARAVADAADRTLIGPDSTGTYVIEESEPEEPAPAREEPRGTADLTKRSEQPEQPAPQTSAAEEGEDDGPALPDYDYLFGRTAQIAVTREALAKLMSPDEEDADDHPPANPVPQQAPSAGVQGPGNPAVGAQAGMPLHPQQPQPQQAPQMRLISSVPWAAGSGGTGNTGPNPASSNPAPQVPRVARVEPAQPQRPGPPAPAPVSPGLMGPGAPSQQHVGVNVPQQGPSQGPWYAPQQQPPSPQGPYAPPQGHQPPPVAPGPYGPGAPPGPPGPPVHPTTAYGAVPPPPAAAVAHGQPGQGYPPAAPGVTGPQPYAVPSPDVSQSGVSAGPVSPAVSAPPAPTPGTGPAPVPAADPASQSGPLILAVLCTQGHLGPPHRSSCRVCGQQIPDQEPFYTQRPPLGVLVLSTGDQVSLDRSIIIGRSPRDDGRTSGDRPHLVKVPSPAKDISRNHVEVTVEGWHVIVEDLGTTNGTTVSLPGQQPMRMRSRDPLVIEPGTVVNLADEAGFTFEVHA